MWEELASHFKATTKLIVAKIDSTANELERVQVSGFPTLKFFPADSERIVDYDGARELDELVAFVDEQLS